MDLTSATPEQIKEFKTAAAARYKEKGIEPKVAEALFEAQMSKIAKELDIKAV